MSARLAAAIVLMLGAGTAAGAELGRLFFTPAQRATLDKMRAQNVGVGKTAADVVPPPPVPHNVTLDGIVRRSDGRNTVWLNNRAVSTPQADGINVATGKNDNRVKLTVPESGRSIDLKVGQTAEIVSGTIAESYARRAPLPKPEAKAEPDTEKATSGTTKATPGADQPATGTAKAAPGAENAASGATKVLTPAASRPVASEDPARNTSKRASEQNVKDDPRARRDSESR